MLQEKETYRFTVLRQITLPDDTSNWVLTLNGDDRYLLPAAYYQGYPIIAGEELDCRIDKINCSGRIYLEPMHPFYVEGKTITLTVYTSGRFTDQAGNTLQKLVFRGEEDTEHTHYCFSTTEYSPGTVVQAMIQQIRKGKLMLKLVDPEPACGPTPGDLSEWKVLKTVLFCGKEMCVAGEEHGLKTYLNPLDYPYLDLSPGQTFTGTLVRLNPSGVPIVEPQHPDYTPGNVYPFRITGSTDSSGRDGEVQTVLLVEDCYGNTIKVYPGYDTAHALLLQNNELNCLVLRLKKGRPVLRVVS